MTYFDDDDDYDELDLARSELEEEIVDPARLSSDPYRLHLGGEATAIATMPPEGSPETQAILDTVPPRHRSLLGDVVRLHQILGDREPMVADLAAEIEAGLRLLFLELEKSPTTIFLGILGNLEPDKRRKEIAKLEGILGHVKQQLNREV